MNGEDPLARAARQAADRAARAAREGEVSLSRRLAQIGVLGWIVVAPTLAGAFLGHWLDRLFGSGIFLTAPLLLGGLGLGCWFGWNWMHQP